MPEANLLKMCWNFIAHFYAPWASDSDQFCQISANERWFSCEAAERTETFAQQKYKKPRNRGLVHIFHCYHPRTSTRFSLPSSWWVSLKLQGPTHSHLVFISWPPPSPAQNPRTHKGPILCLQTLFTWHSYIFHRSKWSTKSQYSVLRLSPNNKWLPAGPMCSLGFY